MSKRQIDIEVTGICKLVCTKSSVIMACPVIGPKVHVTYQRVGVHFLAVESSNNREGTSVIGRTTYSITKYGSILHPHLSVECRSVVKHPACVVSCHLIVTYKHSTNSV